MPENESQFRSFQRHRVFPAYLLHLAHAFQTASSAGAWLNLALSTAPLARMPLL